MNTQEYKSYKHGDIKINYYTKTNKKQTWHAYKGIVIDVIAYHDKKRYVINRSKNLNNKEINNIDLDAVCEHIKMKEIEAFDRENAARMGITYETLIKHLESVRKSYIKYQEKSPKTAMDRRTYELKKQLEMAQYRPADEVITWNGYTFRAGNAQDILKNLNKEVAKPNKKQLALFENEIATESAETPKAVETPEVATAADDPATDYFHNDQLPDNDQLPALPAIVVVDSPANEKTDTPTVKKFEVGKSYYCRSFCDYDCIFTIDIIERKGNKITLKSWDNSILKKIVKIDNDGVEWFRYDRYSMAPIYRANKETAPEEAIKKEVETTAAAHDIPTSEKTEPEPTEQKTAPTDAELIEAAARIRANYEAMQANIEAEPPAPVTYTEDQVQQMIADAVAAALNEEKAKRRQRRISRLSRLLHPARWVALAFVACVLVGLLTGANHRTAEASPDDIGAVIHLRPVTITAEAPQTFINNNEPTAHIEEESPDTAPVKNMAAAEISSQKPAPGDLNTAPDADGLTVCAGTPWAYTMFNWA